MLSRRLPVRLLAVALGAIVLAGCRLDVDVAVDMAADGSGTVTVTATADAELVTTAPTAVQDLRLDDARDAGWTVSGPAPVEGGGSQVVLTKAFASPEQATAILAEINGPGGPLHGLTLSQQREFAKLTSAVTGEVRLIGGLAAFADDALVQVAGKVPLADQVAASGVPLEQALGLTVTVSLPGEVIEANGTAEGGTITWTPSLVDGRVTSLRASTVQEDTAAVRARSVERWTGWALLGWAALFALIVLAVVIRGWRRRRLAT